jgi:putative oxidoreductase
MKQLALDQRHQLLFSRLVLGLVIAPHGAQKLLGWFGGHGFSASHAYLNQHYHVPSLLALLVILAESFGALALMAGLFSRFSAFGITAVMTGALFTHLEQGFFMNWFGNQPGEGFEYHLLALGLAIPLVLRGGGAFALDNLLSPLLARLRTSAGGAQPRSATTDV